MSLVSKSECNFLETPFESAQNDLRAQMRTWIVRRERNGVLRCRMLPLRPSLAFNAPFDIVLRHRCFKYGNEDKVLEFFALCVSQGVNGVG